MTRHLAALALLLSSCAGSPTASQESAFLADCRGGPERVQASFIVRDGDCVKFYSRTGVVIDHACGCGRVVEVGR